MMLKFSMYQMLSLACQESEQQRHRSVGQQAGLRFYCSHTAKSGLYQSIII